MQLLKRVGLVDKAAISEPTIRTAAVSPWCDHDGPGYTIDDNIGMILKWWAKFLI